MKRILFLAILLTGCAQRNYADDSAPTGGAGAGDRAPPCFQSGVCITMAWETAPTESGFGSFTFQARRAGAAVDLEPPPAVLLWMPSMGHGSSPVRVSTLAPGNYRAERVFFPMHGSWELRFQLKEGHEVRDELALPYTF